MMNFRTLATAALFAVHLAAGAQTPPKGAIHIQHPHARATLPGQPVAGGYLILLNPGSEPDRLLSASASVASKVELHTMSMDGNVMRMRPLEAIEVGAGQKVELKPGGLHLMLMGLKAPLKAGEHFPLHLRFERAGDLVVNMDVEAVAGEPASAASR